MILGGQTSVLIPVIFRNNSHVIEGRPGQKDISRVWVILKGRFCLKKLLNFMLLVRFPLSESVSASIDCNSQAKSFLSDEKTPPENLWAGDWESLMWRPALRSGGTVTNDRIEKVLLLLVENYTQYPALSVWNKTGRGNFCGLLWRPIILITKFVSPPSLVTNLYFRSVRFG